MESANRPSRIIPDAGTCCIAVALGLGTMAFWGGSSARAKPAGAVSSERSAGEQRRQWWITDQWSIAGDAIAWKHGWMQVDSAVAIRGDGDSGAWRLRAERLELRLVPTAPRTIAEFHARGNVRVIGPSPLYVAGRRAVSFRPGRTLVMWASDSAEAEDEPRLVGDGWTLTGARISIDFLDDRVTVDNETAREASRTTGAGKDRHPRAAHSRPIAGVNGPEPTDFCPTYR